MKKKAPSQPAARSPGQRTSNACVKALMPAWEALTDTERLTPGSSAPGPNWTTTATPSTSKSTPTSPNPPLPLQPQKAPIPSNNLRLPFESPATSHRLLALAAPLHPALLPPDPLTRAYRERVRDPPDGEALFLRVPPVTHGLRGLSFALLSV